jgi:hypothetical protein
MHSFFSLSSPVPNLGMTKKEAQRQIEIWLRSHSPFPATIINLIAEENGTWRAFVTSEGMNWQHIVTPNGRVSRPLGLN